ncbi:apolipoprotein A-I-like [Thalassophryne amazonica]|uniref:apolipoprotein A-I-like n=1 Tax=Thalassophryne amazonica TaxID=390379 RepID=UPI001471CF08|nr:apolipoprotein A-I-like [Thalassophryne amazonica]
MKVLAVLVLAICTGSQANIFYADQPKSQLEIVEDAFWAYVGKVTQTAEETMKMIKETQLGKDISIRLSESTELATKYAVSLQDQIPSSAQELITKISTEVDALKVQMNQDLSSVKEQLQPFTDDLKLKIEQGVEQIKQELQGSFPNLENLKDTVMEKSDLLKSNLDQSVKHLEAQLGPHTENLKQKVDQHIQKFKEKVSPMTEQVQAQLTQKIQQLQQFVAPYADELKEQLNPHSQNLQQHLNSLYQSFVDANKSTAT